MKKKADWMTKAKKRKVKKRDRGIVDVMMLMQHYFKELSLWFNEMTDPRHPSYTTYTQADLALMGVMKNICAVKSMRSMEENFNEQPCIDTLRILSGDRKLNEMPHSDTLNYYLEQLSPMCLADVRKKMVKSLIRRKVFYHSKLFGKYWRIIIDGTGLFLLSSKLPSTYFQLFRQNKNTPGTKKFDVFSITLFAAWGFCGIISFCNMKTGRNPTDQSFVPAHNHQRLSPHGHLL